MLRLAVLLYAGAIALAFLVTGLRGAPHPFAEQPARIGLGWALAGALLLALVSLALSALAERSGPSRRLRRDLRRMMGPIGSGDALVLAVLSSVGEEALFRGALQPWLGLWVTSALFAFCHVGPARHFAIWTVYAFAMGLGLGALYALSGSLLAPIVAHFTANYFGLLLLAAPAPSEPPSPPPP